MKTGDRRIRPATRAEMQSIFPEFPKRSQIKSFHAAVGSTIAAWQFVEEGLYEVYRAATNAGRPGAEAAAFYSVGAFRAQLRFVGAAVQFVAFAQGRDEIRVTWNTLVNRAAKKSDRRNEIAHGMVWTMFGEKRPERKVYIGPAASDPREQLKQKHGDPEPLTISRVKKYGKDFRELGNQFREFAQRIRQL